MQEINGYYQFCFTVKKKKNRGQGRSSYLFRIKSQDLLVDVNIIGVTKESPLDQDILFGA